MPLAMVFGGGNAVAAYDAGAFEAVAQAGLHPDHVAGASAGAITAVLVAGNPPEQRVAALRAFWEAVAVPGAGVPWIEAPMMEPPLYGTAWQDAAQLVQTAWARLFGRPAMFHPRSIALVDPAAPPGFYDAAPLRRTLEGLVDLSLLQDGPVRVSLLTVDLRTGAEVVFDNREIPVTLDHVLASCALLPNFPPVELEGRALVDGGLAANAPAHLALDPPRDGLTCLVVDPFPLRAPAPVQLLQAQQRQQDLLFASQTRRTLEAMARIWELEAVRPGAEPLRGQLWRLEYASRRETATKGFDFGQAAISRRWWAGQDDMEAVLSAWSGRAPDQAGLVLHDHQSVNTAQ